MLSPKDLLGRELNNIEVRNAPQQLYIKGPMDIPLLRPKVSVVGTRKPTEAGIQETQAIVSMLVDENVTVVSGLAMGIDTIAHRTTITQGGLTVAVLGTPLNMQYPKSNYNLQNEIAAGHLLVSQFPTDYPINKGNFVRRNRTMALISDATVIVEAGNGSGTIHQGWEALRLGRPLFVCRPAAEAQPAWLKEMIQYGATILTDYQDILNEIPLGIKLVDIFVEPAS